MKSNLSVPSWQIFKKSNLQRLLIFLISIVSVSEFTFISHARAGQSQDGQELTVAMSVTSLSAPFVVALEEGYFSKNGLKVTAKEVIGGHRAANALFSGDADIATSSEAVIMFNSFKRSDFTSFGTFVTSDNDVKILARIDTKIQTIPDLKGRKVGTVTGASSHFFLDEVLTLSGVDPSLVEIIHVKPENMKSTLEQGTVDAIVVWEPWIHLTAKALGEKVLIIPHDRSYVETFNALTTRDYAKKHPEVLQNILRSLIQAVDFINRHPEKAQEMVAKRFGKDLSIIKATWSNFKFDVTLDQWLMNTLESEARWAKNSGLVSGEDFPDYLDFFYLPALKLVAPDKVSIL